MKCKQLLLHFPLWLNDSRNSFDSVESMVLLNKYESQKCNLLKEIQYISIQKQCYSLMRNKFATNNALVAYITNKKTIFF